MLFARRSRVAGKTRYDRMMHECYCGRLKSPGIVQEGMNEATIGVGFPHRCVTRLRRIPDAHVRLANMALRFYGKVARVSLVQPVSASQKCTKPARSPSLHLPAQNLTAHAHRQQSIPEGRGKFPRNLAGC